MDDVGVAHERPPRRALDPGQAPGATDDEVLRGYLEQVRSWRSQRVGAVRFRHDDLVVLVGILGTDAKDIERRLIAITGCTRSTAKRFRRLLLVSVAALPVGLTGLVILSPGTDAPSAAVQLVAVVREPATVAAATSSFPILTAVAPAAPVAPPPAVELPPAPIAVAAGTDATVSIPDLGISLPVVQGGQSVIDEGIVAHYTAAGWLPPTPVGDEGTYWLAAHHETHGSPFANLPAIAVGDEVTITTAEQTFTYTVTSMEVVLPDAGFGPVYGPDPEARVILLQTCLDATRRLLVHGTLTATS